MIRRGFFARKESGAKPKRLMAPGREVLDKYVGLPDYGSEKPPVRCLLQVEDGRLLAAVEPDERGALAVDISVVTAGEVALGPLHLDDGRAGVGEAARGIAAC